MTGDIPIKTSGQIKAMRRGGVILRKTLEMVSKAIKPGVSTFELDKIAETFIVSHKGAKPGFKGYHGFPATLCTSVNEEVVHGIPSKDVILQEGDIIYVPPTILAAIGLTLQEIVGPLRGGLGIVSDVKTIKD